MTHRRAIVRLLFHWGGALLIFVLLTSPCFARKIKTQVGSYANFAAYKTYQWLPPKILTNRGIVENDPMVAPAIKAAVNKELTARGLTEVPQGGDLLVATLALTSFFPQLEAVVFANNVPFMYGTPIATMGRYNKEGTFAVNLIDSRVNKYAWAGMVTESIDNKPGSGIKKLPGAASALFSKCPLKKK